MIVKVKAEIEFEMDIFYEFLIGLCSFNITNDGYIRTCINKKNIGLFEKFGYKLRDKVRLHRIIYELYLNRKLNKDEFIDHINHNKLDNRIENLRILDHSQNTKNKKLRENQIYHNIYYDKHNNKFVFQHREEKVEKRFKDLKSAIEFFKKYDKENEYILTKSIHNIAPIDKIENIILQPISICKDCNKKFWSQNSLKQHQKKCIKNNKNNY